MRLKKYDDFLILEKFDSNIKAELKRLGVTDETEINTHLADPGHDYPDFLKKVIDATMRVAEGDLTTEKDRFTRAFVVSDRLVEAIKPEILDRFSTELSLEMESMNPDGEVPDNFIENELKIFLNKNFDVNPAIPLKEDSIGNSYY